MRVGLIGTGWAIRVQLPIFRKAGLEVTAVYSRDAGRASKLAKQHNIPHAFSSVEALCACPDVDLVSIVSPTHLHAQHAAAALKAGKHVLCDKPMDASLESAEALLELSKTCPSQLSIIDHELRFLDCVQHAKTAVRDSKSIGEILAISAHFETSMSFGAKHSWWHSQEMGGGILGAVGVHVIDLCQYISGKKIYKLVALRDSQHKTLPSRDDPNEHIPCTAEDWVSMTGLLEGGQHIGITLSAVGAGANRSVTILGTSGSALLNLDKMTCVINNAARKPVSTVSDNAELPDAFLQGTLRIAQALATAKSNPAHLLNTASSLAEGVHVLSVVEAIRRSQGSWVNVHHRTGSAAAKL